MVDKSQAEHSLIELAERVEKSEGPDRRILDRLNRDGDCWLWTGPLDRRGRGRVSFRGSIALHHRAVWQILVGPIPAGGMLCHHCDNPTCANPAHLYVGDAKSNAADMSSRKRTWAHRNPELAKATGDRIGHANDWSKGERNPKAKLTPEQVEQVRATRGASSVVARQFGVHATTIQRIRRGASWS